MKLDWINYNAFTQWKIQLEKLKKKKRMLWNNIDFQNILSEEKQTNQGAKEYMQYATFCMR